MKAIKKIPSCIKFMKLDTSFFSNQKKILISIEKIINSHLKDYKFPARKLPKKELKLNFLKISDNKINIKPKKILPKNV